MKRVTAYETSDGKAFTDKIEAMRHEFFLDIRAAIQVNLPPHEVRNNGSLINVICHQIRDNSDLMAGVLSQNRQRLRRALADATPAEPSTDTSA